MASTNCLRPRKTPRRREGLSSPPGAGTTRDALAARGRGGCGDAMGGGGDGRGAPRVRTENARARGGNVRGGQHAGVFVRRRGERGAGVPARRSVGRVRVCRRPSGAGRRAWSHAHAARTGPGRSADARAGAGAVVRPHRARVLPRRPTVHRRAYLRGRDMRHAAGSTGGHAPRAPVRHMDGAVLSRRVVQRRVRVRRRHVLRAQPRARCRASCRLMRAAHRLPVLRGKRRVRVVPRVHPVPLTGRHPDRAVLDGVVHQQRGVLVLTHPTG